MKEKTKKMITAISAAGFIACMISFIIALINSRYIGAVIFLAAAVFCFGQAVSYHKSIIEKSPNSTLARKRSMVLFILGIPMMYISSFSDKSIVCMIITVIYLILLLINAIICFPLVIEMIKNKK